MEIKKGKGESNFSLINKVPDRDSMELCLYGSAYTHVKEKLFQIDGIADILNQDLEKIIEEILGFTDIRHLTDALKDDPFRKIDVNEDQRLVVLQTYVRKMAALDWCEARRQDVIMFGRIIGSAERGRTMRFSDDIGEIWSRSVQELGKTPIEYRRRDA